MPTLRATRWDDPVVAALSAAQQVEVRARCDGAGEPGVPPSAQDVAVETGPRQPEAVDLCTGAGYRPVAAFGAHAGLERAGTRRGQR